MKDSVPIASASVHGQAPLDAVISICLNVVCTSLIEEPHLVWKLVMARVGGVCWNAERVRYQIV
jgi:hypothetical protein